MLFQLIKIRWQNKNIPIIFIHWRVREIVDLNYFLLTSVNQYQAWFATNDASTCTCEGQSIFRNTCKMCRQIMHLSWKYHRLVSYHMHYSPLPWWSNTLMVKGQTPWINSPKATHTHTHRYVLTVGCFGLLIHVSWNQSIVPRTLKIPDLATDDSDDSVEKGTVQMYVHEPKVKNPSWAKGSLVFLLVLLIIHLMADLCWL